MDYILKKLTNRTGLSEEGTYDRIIFMRERIEYCLFFILGYLWKNFHEVSQENKEHIIVNLKDMSIGRVVETIRLLDIDKTVLPKVAIKTINEYPKIRNSKIGHGYELSSDVANTLESFYDKMLLNIPLLSNEYDYIVVNNECADTYKGIRIGLDGMPKRWNCPKESFGYNEMYFPRTYVLFKNKYWKISPFVFLDENGDDIFIFNKLKEKITGNTYMNQICKSGEKHLEFEELVCIFNEDGFRKKSANGTIINKFDKNYKDYIDIGMTNYVMDFLTNKNSNVAATLHGHGGVGKTACIQRVCDILFSDIKKVFSYIVFVTAKDRVYNPKTGEIDEIASNVRLYSDAILTICRTIFGNEELSEEINNLETFESDIINFKDEQSRILIIIDDFETFADAEKEKFKLFIDKLDIRYHRVIITTRNSKLLEGCWSIPTNELDLDKTKYFLKKVIEKEYPDQTNNVNELIEDNAILNKIFKATSGRPIFIYQFAHLFVQRGYKEEFLSNLSSSNNASEFLYGRIFDCLSQTAKTIFLVISQIVNDDLLFRYDLLEYVLSKNISDVGILQDGINELADQLVIEKNTKSTELGRVYSTELCDTMKKRYQMLDQPFRHTIKNMLDSVGGKNISGSIYEAMLAEANNSRSFGNSTEIEEKYRRILNNKKSPIEIRKRALLTLGTYLKNDRINSDAAIMAYEEYLNDFKNDADIHKDYVSLLWEEKVSRKKDAIAVIQKFFGENKKTDRNNLDFFALSVGYCIDYVTNDSYDSKLLRKNQWKKTWNEYGRELYEYMSKFSFTGFKPQIRMDIIFGLRQTIKLCYNLGKMESSSAMLDIGIKIVNLLESSKLMPTEIRQINILRDKILDYQRSYFRDNCELNTNSGFAHNLLDSEPEEEIDFDMGDLVVFEPQYIKYDRYNGFPKYLNGKIGSKPAGLSKMDIESFDEDEIKKFKGIENIFNQLIAKGNITAKVKFKGKSGYCLSLAETGVTLTSIFAPEDVNTNSLVEDANKPIVSFKVDADAPKGLHVEVADKSIVQFKVDAEASKGLHGTFDLNGEKTSGIITSGVTRKEKRLLVGHSIKAKIVDKGKTEYILRKVQ